jgi:hypothetical protein
MPALGLVRRQKGDGSLDSICLTCFLTAARGVSEEELDAAEQAHICERAILAECARRHEDFQRGTF